MSSKFLDLGNPGGRPMKKKIKYADKDVLSDKDFEAQNVKERITIWIDQSTLDAFRDRAKEEGSPLCQDGCRLLAF